MPIRKADARYSAIAQQLRVTLAAMPPGARLASVRALAEEHGCSLTTIQKAFTELRNAGLIASRSRTGVYAQTGARSGVLHGRILCAFPRWDSLREESFAAQYLLGSSIAASECGFAIEACPYGSAAEMQAIPARALHGRFSGLLWANPSDPVALTRAEASGVKTVQSLRHYPVVPLPFTADDFTQGYAALVAALQRGGIRSVGILAAAFDDVTYAPALAILRNQLTDAGIAVPTNAISHVRGSNVGAAEARHLLRRFLTALAGCDACWAFACDGLEQAQAIARAAGLPLERWRFGVQSIRAVPLPPLDWVLESDVRAHGDAAMRLLASWIKTGKAPQPVLVPMELREPGHRP